MSTIIFHFCELKGDDIMNGSEIFNRFCKELIDKGVSKSEFCKSTGTTPSALSNWQKRGTMPSSDLVMTISNYLGCSTDYILGKTNIRNVTDKGIEFPIDEMNLLEAYRTATPEEQRMILEMIAFFKSKKQDN